MTGRPKNDRLDKNIVQQWVSWARRYPLLNHVELAQHQLDVDKQDRNAYNQQAHVAQNGGAANIPETSNESLAVRETNQIAYQNVRFYLREAMKCRRDLVVVETFCI